MDIRIIYEDNSIIVCIKPVGVESEGAGMPALLKRLCSAEEVYCVHRLDKAVSGLMVFAKTKRAAAALSRAIADGSLEKEYFAVLPRRPEPDNGILRDLLYHDAAKNKSYPVRRMRRGVREASLEYRLCGTAGELSLVRIKLHTGRSHQIRVQFASRAMPLLGDVKYGSAFRACPPALFSCALSFPHPQNGERLCFTAVPDSVFPWDSFDLLDNKHQAQL